MGNHLVKIAVLLAAYEGEKFLPPLLDSLSAQTWSDFHVLYQDDGSADRTAEILREAAARDARFRAGEAQGQHLGAVGNFLSLLRQTDADVVFLCDQDDVWERDKLARLCAAMREEEARFGRETPLLIHSDCSLIDSEGRSIGPSFFRLQGWDPKAVTLAPLLVQNNATGCTMALNRALADLVRTHGRAETMFMHDWFIALTAAAFGHIRFVDQPLVRYRQHGGNTIGASRESLPRRAAAALHHRREARERIALTYRHTRAFQQAYGALLPPPAGKLVADYLATESLPKLRRIRAVRSLGCVMQSPVTRLGQLLFG